MVFYNGEDEKEDETILSLSDAFKEEIRQNVMHRHSRAKEDSDDVEVSAEVERIFWEADPDIDVRVRMVNINYGHNRDMLSMCKPLGEYAWFVEQARKSLVSNRKRGDDERVGIGEIIDRVIDEMPEDFEIKKFITANRAEVKDMCLTEYNETETIEMLWREGHQEGLQEGRQETMRLNIKNLMDSTGWTAEKAMDILKIPQDQRTAFYVDLPKNV